MAEPLSIVIDDDTETVRVDPVTGTVEETQPDGGVVVRLDAARPKEEGEESDFYENLAVDIDAQRLALIANDLIEAIKADDDSRQEYLDIRSRGLNLLGTKLQEPKATVGDGSAPLDGMSTVTNPLLLEACLKGWANAQSELLPANGPAKIRDDGDETRDEDDLAERLERDFNHYLTKGAPEYYPDTSHMLLWGVYFGGSGFKKVYRCPLRRRPVSDSVDAKDLIVSDTTKDFGACSRITHQIPMRASVLKRMVLDGAYRQTKLTQPTPQPNAVDATIASIQGTEVSPNRPEDQPYTIWETQCELDLPEYAPGKFKGTGIPLPYLVTLDKDSQEILAIRRDWDEEDEECTRRKMYVKYPYVPGPGFYGTGMLNILGNASAAMTAAWREALDAGMFANFPAGVIAKLGGRQNTSDFRLSPGVFQPIETNGMPIGSIMTGLPYKDVTAGLLSLIQQITAQARALGGSAELPAAEGVQNVPVGTMLSQIEQATKVMAAAHKGMHQAQSEEFDLLIKLFRENPEDFWRGNRDCPKNYWSDQKLIQALDNCKLVPVSDPNVPSHIHRVAKAVALSQLIMMPPFASRLDPDETLHRILSALREDPNGLVVVPAPQAAAPPPPGEVAKVIDAQTKQQKVGLDASIAAQKQQTQDREIQAQKDLKTIDLAKELVIHGGDMAEQQRAAQREERQHGLDVATHGLAVAQHGLAARTAAQETAIKLHQALNPTPAGPAAPLSDKS